MCGFLGNNKCLHLGTPAIVTLFLLQSDPAPIREGKRFVALTGKSLGTPDLNSEGYYYNHSSTESKKLAICPTLSRISCLK